MKRWLVAVVVMGFAVTGCSKSSGSVSASKSGDSGDAKATLVKFLQGTVSDLATDKQAACWAEALIADVGAKDALTVTSQDPESVPAKEVQIAASSALAGCIEPWEMIAMSADASDQTLTDEQVSCLKDGFDEKTAAEFKKAMKTGGASALTEALVKKCTAPA